MIKKRCIEDVRERERRYQNREDYYVIYERRVG